MDIWNYLVISWSFLLRTTFSGMPYQLGLQDRIINSNTVCGNTPGLTSRQAHLCSQHPHAVASAIQGMQIAIHECKVQFKDHRWNCSSLETKNKIPHTSSFLTSAEGNKEIAFSFAITSAGVAHQVAHACSLGKIKECECPQTKPPVRHLTAGQRKRFQERIKTKPDVQQQPVQTFARAGCDHNINYGMEFAVKFLDSNEEQDIISTTRSHNNRVGRLIVANNMRENCRCHGTSGSCSQKTCWRETPDFRAVGKALKEKYKAAIRVSPDAVERNEIRESNEVRNHRRLLEKKPFDFVDLIFLDTSPDYCNPNPAIGFPGTSGRFCNSTAREDEPNSCESLCCHRGYRTIKLQIIEQCKCRFHWCCYVDCEECERIETVSICN